MKLCPHIDKIGHNDFLLRVRGDIVASTFDSHGHGPEILFGSALTKL